MNTEQEQAREAARKAVQAFVEHILNKHKIMLSAYTGEARRASDEYCKLIMEGEVDNVLVNEVGSATAVTAATLIENSKAAKQTVFPDPVDPNNVPKLYGSRLLRKRVKTQP